MAHVLVLQHILLTHNSIASVTPDNMNLNRTSACSGAQSRSKYFRRLNLLPHTWSTRFQSYDVQRLEETKRTAQAARLCTSQKQGKILQFPVGHSVDRKLRLHHVARCRSKVFRSLGSCSLCKLIKSARDCHNVLDLESRRMATFSKPLTCSKLWLLCLQYVAVTSHLGLRRVNDTALAPARNILINYVMNIAENSQKRNTICFQSNFSLARSSRHMF